MENMKNEGSVKQPKALIIIVIVNKNKTTFQIQQSYNY